MGAPSTAGTVASLRERKKAKTRRMIQEQALRLFAEQGYDGTTIEQIAEAAEISPSTFFRYFPTKEDVVLDDDYDPAILLALRAQPPAAPPLAALRGALREVFGRVLPQERAANLARAKLIFSVPALRTRRIEARAGTRLLTQALAERLGRTPDDLEVRIMAAAVSGAWLVAIEQWVASDGRESLPDLVDRALVFLENGMPI
jgi:AcrR family transcriptional regulator